MNIVYNLLSGYGPLSLLEFYENPIRTLMITSLVLELYFLIFLILSDFFRYYILLNFQKEKWKSVGKEEI